MNTAGARLSASIDRLYAHARKVTEVTSDLEQAALRGIELADAGKISQARTHERRAKRLYVRLQQLHRDWDKYCQSRKNR